MILSELIRNASRQAFCGGSGNIQVELSNRSNLGRMLVTDKGMRWSLSGRGMAKIVLWLARDLNGGVDHRFGARGTKVTLSFALVQTELDHAMAIVSKNSDLPVAANEEIAMMNVNPYLKIAAVAAALASSATLSGATLGQTQPRADVTDQAVAPITHYRTAKIDGLDIFYREAGPRTDPSFSFCTVFQPRRTCSAT